MLIASIKSDKFPNINGLNDIPFVGSAIIALGSVLTMFGIHELIQETFDTNKIFDLSFTFFLNNLFMHIFLAMILDIKIKLFFYLQKYFVSFVLSSMHTDNGIQLLQYQIFNSNNRFPKEN